MEFHGKGPAISGTIHFSPINFSPKSQEKPFPCTALPCAWGLFPCGKNNAGIGIKNLQECEQKHGITAQLPARTINMQIFHFLNFSSCNPAAQGRIRWSFPAPNILGFLIKSLESKGKGAQSNRREQGICGEEEGQCQTGKIHDCSWN